MNRRNRAEYARALSTLKRWDRKSRPEEWATEEWNDFMARTSTHNPAGQEPVRFPLLRPLVSAAAALIVLVWAALFLLKIRPEDLSARNETRTAEITIRGSEDSRPSTETVSPDAVQPADSAASRPGAFSERRNLLASAARTPRPAGDKPAFTWISPDTGLQIVWFTNNNLKLED